MLLAVLAAGPACAQSAGAFARLGFGARGPAVGNALAADVSGAASPFYNPALAPFIEQQHLSAAAGLLTFDRELQHLQFAAPLRPRAGVAAGMIHAGVADIDGRDESGYHTRDYRTDAYAFWLGFGVRVSDRVTLGAGLQIFQSSYPPERVVSTLGLDVGATVRITERFSMGLAVDDLLARYEGATQLGGGSQADHFPLRIRLGGSYAFEGVQLLAEYESRFLSAVQSTGPPQMSGRRRLHEGRFRFGAEAHLVDALVVRAGLDRVAVGTVESVLPGAGFRIEQAVGQLTTHLAYTFVLEPHAAGAMHLAALHLFL